VLVNIGGIANISIIPSDSSKKITGYDTGPGNTLIDAWVRKHYGLTYDKNGELALKTEANASFLEHMLRDPYFSKAPPKSTGREQFTMDWLDI
jgi:anhydro-N-acetylmuramic acid kinase